MDYICFECAMKKGGRKPENGIIEGHNGMCMFCLGRRVVAPPSKFTLCFLSDDTKQKLKERIYGN